MFAKSLGYYNKNMQCKNLNYLDCLPGSNISNECISNQCPRLSMRSTCIVGQWGNSLTHSNEFF